LYVLFLFFFDYLLLLNTWNENIPKEAHVIGSGGGPEFDAT
jgi:hypothetical protein